MAALAGKELFSEGGEAEEDFRGFFGFGEWGKLGGDVRPVEVLRAGADDGHTNIAPVLIARGEGFHDDEVFRGADAEADAIGIGDVGGAGDGECFKGESTEGDVEAGAVVGLEEKDAVQEGEGAGIRTAWAVT